MMLRTTLTIAVAANRSAARLPIREPSRGSRIVPENRRKCLNEQAFSAGPQETREEVPRRAGGLWRECGKLPEKLDAIGIQHVSRTWETGRPSAP